MSKGVGSFAFFEAVVRCELARVGLELTNQLTMVSEGDTEKDSYFHRAIKAKGDFKLNGLQVTEFTVEGRVSRPVYRYGSRRSWTEADLTFTVSGHSWHITGEQSPETGVIVTKEKPS